MIFISFRGPKALNDNPEEYYLRYSNIAGRSRVEAEGDIAGAKRTGTLSQEVEDLKYQVAAKVEEMKGETAELLSKLRKRLLLVGLSLVILALWGHALLASADDRDSGTPGPHGATISTIDDPMQHSQENEALQNRRIAELETQLADQRKILEAVLQENKRWHIHRARLKRCPATGSSHCCATIPTSLSGH